MTSRQARIAALLLLAAPAVLPLAAVRAYPEGAPWTALDHPEQGCASCHFGDAPVQASTALSVEGLGGELKAGTAYPVTVRFEPDRADVAGFLASFRAGGGEAGAVRTEGANTETQGSAIRAAARALDADGGATWTFVWTAPETPSTVDLHLGAVAGNDDASPFGDRVHLKTVVLEVR